MTFRQGNKGLRWIGERAFMRGRTRPIESPAHWLGTVPVAPDGTARITIDGGKLLNLTPRETVGSGGRI
jgi:hypothetical protein